ncbi:hypothetical protein EI94DRAFT_1746504 [Lactarius quietus]|nr:hypothetical protein EI94DRAFT_1746504 [Lactarius quietus]
MRLGCLKSLWYHEIACHYLRAPGSLPALDSFPIHLITPEIASRIHTEEEISVRVIGRCFASLVMNRLAAKSKAFGDHEMAFLSAILRTERRAAIHRHFTAPGVVQLINVVFLLFGEFSFFATNTVPPYVLHIVGHTIGALIQALPAELSAELQLDRSESQMNVPDSQIKSVIVSHLRDLFKACTLRPFPLPEAVRTYCLKMCLYGLWRWGKALHQLGTSQQLPPEFLDLAGLEVTSHIRKETNQVTCMMGHCVQALVVVNLVVRIQSRNHSNPSDEELACISAILGTESHDLRLWFTLPGVVEFANVVSLVLTETEISFTDTSLSDVLDSDMIKQTIRILRWQLPPGLDAGLMKLSDGMYPPIYDSDSHSCICLKRLWQFARVYNGPEISTPLPPFVRTTLASPKFTRRLHAESDLPTRVIGRCVQALIVNKLVDDFQSRISLSIGVLDAELASISSILDIVPGEFSRWPRLSVVIKLQNVIFLMSGEIEDLFSSSATAPADVLYIVRKTLNAICSDLVLGGVFAGRDLPMDQVSSLREICSSIANARHPNRFDGRTVEILDRLQQISKQLPTVKHTIRRCTSTIFDSKSVRGRSDLTTRPEYEVRRRSGSV